jgi:hypothetical protein
MCGRLVFFLGKAILIRDHPYITSANGLGGWVRKMAIFAAVQYYIYANVGWMGESEKVQKCADVIIGWSLTQRHPLQSKLFSTCVANDGSTFLQCFQL